MLLKPELLYLVFVETEFSTLLFGGIYERTSLATTVATHIKLEP
jgi:hypothetical protein